MKYLRRPWMLLNPWKMKRQRVTVRRKLRATVAKRQAQFDKMVDHIGKQHQGIGNLLPVLPPSYERFLQPDYRGTVVTIDLRVGINVWRISRLIEQDMINCSTNARQAVSFIQEQMVRALNAKVAEELRQAVGLPTFAEQCEQNHQRMSVRQDWRYE